MQIKLLQISLIIACLGQCILSSNATAKDKKNQDDSSSPSILNCNAYVGACEVNY